MPGPQPTPIEQRWHKFTETEGCWLWEGQINDAGYGLIWSDRWDDGKRHYLRAHRVVYEFMVGPIPEELELDHTCRNRACVRPGEGHVMPTTHRLNVIAGMGPTATNARKTHCDEGHPLVQVATRGDRGCRICINKKRSQRKLSHRSTP